MGIRWATFKLVVSTCVPLPDHCYMSNVNIKRRGRPYEVFSVLPDHFNELYKVTLQKNVTHYVIPKGENLPYFSFAEIATKGLEGAYGDNPVIRHASIANKWKTIHLIMHNGMNATVIHFNLTFQNKDDQVFKMQVTLEVDTREGPKMNITSTQKPEGDVKTTTATPEVEIIFEDIPEEERFPRVKKRPNGTVESLDGGIVVPQVDMSVLPEDVKLALQNLDLQLEGGDITQKGYNLSKAALLKPFQLLTIVRNNFQNTRRKEAYVDLGARKNLTTRHNSYKSNEGDKADFERKRHEVLSLEPIGSTLVAMKVNSYFPLKHNSVVKSELTPVVQNAGEKKESREKILNVIQQNETQKPKEIRKEKMAEEKKESRNVAQAHAEEGTAGSQSIPGRKLQYYAGNYPGFLPWEKHKYFQDLLDVSVSEEWDSVERSLY